MTRLTIIITGFAVLALLAAFVLSQSGILNPERARLETQAARARLEFEQAQRAALEPWMRAATIAWSIILLALGAGLVGVVIAYLARLAAEVRPNQAGVFPLLRLHIAGTTILHDPNRSQVATTVFTDPANTVQIVPVVHEAGRGQSLVALAALALQAGAPRRTIAAAPKLLDATPPMAALPDVNDAWPDRVDLLGVLPSQPTLENLVIGVTLDAGRITPITASLHNLMHVLLVGASGWGKSTWLRSFLYQVAASRDLATILAVDISGSEFNILETWSRLRYPVARTDQDAIAIMEQVSNEIERRRGLYANLPLATRLDEYNRMADQALEPWIVVIDEGTHLLNQAGVGARLRAAVQTARQYGVYVLMAGQSVKSDVVDTQTRDQFSTRLCFRTSRSSSLVVLDDRAASALPRPGRAFALLPGRDLVEILAPTVSRDALARVVGGGRPQMAMPEPERITQAEDQDTRIVALHRAGRSQRAIEQEIFGYTGGRAHAAVVHAIGATTTAGDALQGATSLAG